MTAPTPPECDPERVETVARALEAACRRLAFSDDAEPWPSPEDLRTLAAAAIAADQSPAELAVKRVEALADDYQRVADEILAEEPQSIYRERVAQAGYSTAARIRAALASPAPAPHDGCTCDNVVPRKGSGRWG